MLAGEEPFQAQPYGFLYFNCTTCLGQHEPWCGHLVVARRPPAVHLQSLTQVALSWGHCNRIPLGFLKFSLLSLGVTEDMTASHHRISEPRARS